MIENGEIENNIYNVNRFFSQTARDVRDRIQDHFDYRLLVEYTNVWPLSPPYFSISKIATRKLLGIFPFQEKKKVFILYSQFFNDIDSGKTIIYFIIYDEIIKDITNTEVEKLAKKFVVEKYGFIKLNDSFVGKIIKKIKRIPNIKKI